VQLDDEELFVRHRVEIAVQAVDDHDPCLSLLDRAADRVDELARGELGRIDLLHADQPCVDVLA
jgi:hypothetical protein